MVNLIVIFMSIVFVNNFVLSQFLGICSFLGVSNKMSSAVGMGGAVVFVMVIAEAVTWPIMQLLNKFEIGYLQTVVFILVIAALVTVRRDVHEEVPAFTAEGSRYLPSADHNKLRDSRSYDQRDQLWLYIRTVHGLFLRSRLRLFRSYGSLRGSKRGKALQ